MPEYDESGRSFMGDVKKEVIDCDKCEHDMVEDDGRYFCKICKKEFGGKI